MIQKAFQNQMLPALGLGCMRLPVLDGDNSHIDQEQVNEMVHYAMEHDVNYFDTAWGYHDGQSEIAVGEALKAYPRNTYFVASKFPGYDITNFGKEEEIFARQLEKTGLDYFDFYLFHNVCESNIEQYLDPAVRNFLVQMKEEGKIRHLGFSAHGTIDTMRRFLDAYHDDLEFCQIQLNWMDYDFQDAKGKIELLNEYHLPVWVMEPLRGKKLVEIDPEAKEKLEKISPERSLPEWAFRFLQAIPEVCVTLSGMSNLEQLKENIKTFETDEPLSEEEFEFIRNVSSEMIRPGTVPCTACRYCTEKCPKELDIPEILSVYNEFLVSKGGFIAPMRIGMMEQEKQPQACIGCKSCERVCPQNIHVSEIMKDFAERVFKK